MKQRFRPQMWGLLLIGIFTLGGCLPVQTSYGPGGPAALTFEQRAEPAQEAQRSPDPADEESRGIPPAAALTPEIRREVIEQIGALLVQNYVFPARADVMARRLHTQMDGGRYDDVVDPELFARRLTQDLHAVYADIHLRVRWRGPASEAPVESAAEPPFHNWGFMRAEVLPGNVGYLDLRAFVPEGEETAAGAMAFLAGTQALIFDIRQNGGGTPELVRFLISYLVEKPVHINSVYSRPTDTTQEFWTLETLPGLRLAEQPVFVLVSSRTFSGAEEFAYDLQALGRATIIGEVTGGGAHPTRPHPLPHGFSLSVPFARAINPITGTNWEGKGVVPDVETSAEAALEVAHEMALKAIEEARQKWDAETQALAASPQKLSEAVLERYVGKYALGRLQLSIALQDGALMASSQQFPPMPLLPLSETTFVVAPEMRLQFLADDQGSVREIILIERSGSRVRGAPLDR